MLQATSWLARVAAAVAVGVPVVWPQVAAAELPLQIAWKAQIGTAKVDGSTSVAVDVGGNAYISGGTTGNLGGLNAGNFDIFLTKFDASGQVLWSRQIGTTGSDDSGSVVVDGGGNVYLSGSTSGSLGGPNAGSSDAFLTKFDTSGNILWTRQFGTPFGDNGTSVAVDGGGNVYISGFTTGSLGGPNASGFSSWDSTNKDAFLVKFDASGNELWTRQIGTTAKDFSASVSVDGMGNAYISGGTEGSLGGPNAGGHDAFLTKFDASGNVLWSRQIGTTGTDGSNSVAVDGGGNAYISGITDGSLGGPNAGSRDAFLTKFDASGNILWTRQIGTTADDRSDSVTVDGAGNAFISGFTDGSLEGTSAGAHDAYLTKFDPAGNLLWTQQVGTVEDDESASVAVDGTGNAYISGFTTGSLGGPNAGRFDAFLVKFAVPEPASITLLALGGLTLLRRRR